MGCLAAIFCWRYRLSERALLALKWSGLTLMAGSFVFKSSVYRSALGQLGLNVTLLELGTAFLLVFVYERYTKGSNKMTALLSPLCWYGRNSYEIYLTHLFVIIPLYGLFSVENIGETGASFGMLAM